MGLVTKATFLAAAAICFFLLGLAQADSSPAAASKPKPPIVHWFTDMNTDDVQAIAYLLKFTQNFELGSLITDCTGWCNVGPAIQNAFGLLAMMDADDVPVFAGDAYAVVAKDSGTYGCQYQNNVPLYPHGKTWADTLLGLNYKYFPRPSNDKRNYYPNFPEAVSSLPAIINATAHNREIIFVVTGPFSTVYRLFSQNPWLKQRVSRIHVMGGAVYVPGNLFFPYAYVPNTYAESNIYSDPQAAQGVIQTGVPMTIVPLDATDSFNANFAFLNTTFAKAKTREAKFCRELIYLNAANTPAAFANSIWDVVAVSILVEPSLVTKRSTINISVITEPFVNGTNQVGRLAVDNVNGKPIDVVLGINQAAFPHFVDALNKKH